MSWVPQPPPKSPNFFIRTVEPFPPNILSITDNNSESIMTIESDGTIVWHNEGKAPEAAAFFIDALQDTLEQRTGIKQGRKEWEERILKAMLSAAENAPLTPEKLTEVFKKCIMIDKLKGIK